MKTTSFHFLLVSLIWVTLAMLCPQVACATGASSTEINNAIVLEGSIPLTWENDEVYPWVIDDGKLKSGNAGVKNSCSKLKLKYSSSCVTNISFNYKNNYRNSSSHYVEILVDGLVKYNSNNSSSIENIGFRLPIGNHSIEIRDSIGNTASNNYYATLWNVSVIETTPATATTLNNTIRSNRKHIPLTFFPDGTGSHISRLWS